MLVMSNSKSVECRYALECVESVGKAQLNADTSWNVLKASANADTSWNGLKASARFS